MAGIVLPVPSATAAAPNFTALLGSSPYIPLMTTENDCVRTGTINTAPDREAQLDQLRRWYTHFHADTANFFPFGPYGSDCPRRGTETLAAGLARRGAMVSNYRNGSATSQGDRGQLNFNDARDLEATAPLSIGTFWPGNPKLGKGAPASPASRLASPVDASTTTIRVTSAAANKPSVAPATWPFINSRGSGLQAGATSDSTADFVSWVRIGEELLQIVEEPALSGDIVTLKVRRGAFGTSPSAAAQSARVFAPLYIGSEGLSGTPKVNDPNAALRYSLKIWKSATHEWIARRINETFGAGLGGHNTVWLDVSSCNLFNLADAYKQETFPWDDPAQKLINDDSWGAYQRTKVAGLRQRLPGVQFTANAFRDPTDECAKDLLATAYDGASLEGWMKGGPSAEWPLVMDYAFETSANNWPAIYWLRWDRGINYTSDPRLIKRYSYGSLLLAYNAASQRFQYGGPWGLVKPDELFFWNWGAPTGPQPAGIAELQVPGTPLYKREFANAIVVVNASKAPQTYRLNGTYYDVVNKVNRKPSPVTSVTIGAGDAAFLLRSAP